LEHPRVPLLRERLGIAGDNANTTYDTLLSEAVKTFQRQHDLAPNRRLERDHRRTEWPPAATGMPMSSSPTWRREGDGSRAISGRAHVVVNIPDYTLKAMDHGAMVWATKIVAGQPGERATPLLSETMKYITVNPTWNVPPSIINNKYLPTLAQDPTVLDRMGLKLEHNRDGSVHIYQPPGEANALGRTIKGWTIEDSDRLRIAREALAYFCFAVEHSRPNSRVRTLELA
jgi:L,D-transpeptidase YcbB